MSTLTRQWMEYGLCVNLDVNLFFDKYETDDVVKDNVKKLCSLCPVKDVCIEYGEQNGAWGVWGGKYLQNGKEIES